MTCSKKILTIIIIKVGILLPTLKYQTIKVYRTTEKIVRKGLVVRLYPTEEQKIFLNKSFGCERLFYNYLLNEKNEFYKNEIEPIKDDEIYIVQTYY